MAELGDVKKKPSGAQHRKRKLEKEEKIKKLTSPIDSFFRPGSQLNRMREARRIQRMRRAGTPPSSDESVPSPCPPAVVDKALQNRVIMELACKTVALMHKNRLIQQKIVALQKETSDFVATIMKNPENRRRYFEHVRLYGTPQRLQLQIDHGMNRQPIKVEPTA